MKICKLTFGSQVVSRTNDTYFEGKFVAGVALNKLKHEDSNKLFQRK